MGFVKLPSENPARCQGESSADMQVDVQSLEETPAEKHQINHLVVTLFLKGNLEVLITLSKAVGLSSFPGFIIMSQMTVHFAGSLLEQQKLNS